MSEDDDILAAEIALGVLDRDEALAAKERLPSDRPLADRVEWWRMHFAALTTDASAPPSEQLWIRIVKALPHNDNMVAVLRRWQAGAVAASLVAMVLGATLLLQSPVPVAGSGTVPTPLLATLDGAQGASATLAYDQDSGQLTIAPSKLDPGKRAAELWIIPADGTPRSLGVIDPHQASARTISAARRTWIVSGSSFAITLEPAGGSLSGLPTGPVVASGKIFGV